MAGSPPAQTVPSSGVAALRRHPSGHSKGALGSSPSGGKTSERLAATAPAWNAATGRKGPGLTLTPALHSWLLSLPSRPSTTWPSPRCGGGGKKNPQQTLQCCKVSGETSASQPGRNQPEPRPAPGPSGSGWERGRTVARHGDNLRLDPSGSRRGCARARAPPELRGHPALARAVPARDPPVQGRGLVGCHGHQFGKDIGAGDGWIRGVDRESFHQRGTWGVNAQHRPVRPLRGTDSPDRASGSTLSFLADPRRFPVDSPCG